jgi:hypothetical protein
MKQGFSCAPGNKGNIKMMYTTFFLSTKNDD